MQQGKAEGLLKYGRHGWLMGTQPQCRQRVSPHKSMQQKYIIEVQISNMVIPVIVMTRFEVVTSAGMRVAMRIGATLPLVVRIMAEPQVCN